MNTIKLKDIRLTPLINILVNQKEIIFECQDGKVKIFLKGKISPSDIFFIQ